MISRSNATQHSDDGFVTEPALIALVCQGPLTPEHLSITSSLNDGTRYRVVERDRLEGAEPIALLLLHIRCVRFPVPRLPHDRAVRRVIVLSDDTSEPAIVSTLDSGAHHYFPINEPLRLVEARVKAALREHGGVFEQRLDIPPFRFDLDKREVLRSGERVNLSPKEFEFAYYLFANRDRVIPNSELMTSVWSLPAAMDTRRIDTAACRIRKKMPLDDRSGWVLRRLRSVGYEICLCKAREETGRSIRA